MKHSLFRLELVKNLMEETRVKLGNNLIMVFRESKIECGIVGKLACFFVDLFYSVELVVGLEETIAPGAHDCCRLMSAGIPTVGRVARCVDDGLEI